MFRAALIRLAFVVVVGLIGYAIVVAVPAAAVPLIFGLGVGYLVGRDHAEIGIVRHNIKGMFARRGAWRGKDS